MKRIIVTRPRLQADSLAGGLQAAGFEPVFFPVIEIRPVQDYSRLELALQNLHAYAWLVFTSVNGVNAVLDRFPLPTHPNGTSSPRYAAIGPKTAAALRERGLNPAFVPEEYVAEAILPGLGDLCGKWVLLPRAEIARKALP
ncbi:MAG: uroporphyrinogen-III synthase, partial [Bacteroidota bacterium]